MASAPAVAAADGDGADRGFAAAAEFYARFGNVWIEAETYEHWALALSSHDHAAAAAMLDRALDVYVGHGAGEAWRERIRRRRASLGLTDPVARVSP